MTMNFYTSVGFAFIGLANIGWNVKFLRGIFEKSSNVVLPEEPRPDILFRS